MWIYMLTHIWSLAGMCINKVVGRYFIFLREGGKQTEDPIIKPLACPVDGLGLCWLYLLGM